MQRSPRLDAALTTFGPAVGIFAVQQLFFPAPAGVVVRGLIIGALTALVAVGMALIYRANHIVNFAQAELGQVPAGLGVLLVTFGAGAFWTGGVPYWAGFAAALLAGPLLGALVELTIIRRFRRSPRLILTVATIGLSQLLALGALLLPAIWDERPGTYRVTPPFDWHFTIDPIVFRSEYVIAVIVAPIAMIAVGLFLSRTRVGVAVRASAESLERATLLGIPAPRLQTVVWAVAGLLAATATFLRAGITGLPFGFGLTFTQLLAALAALTLGRMTHLPTIATSAVALGVLELGVDWGAESAVLIDPILALIVVAGLLLQRRGTSRADRDATSTWQAAEEVRPIPPELRRLPEVRWARRIGVAVLAAVVVALPHWMSVGQTFKASAVLIFAMIAASIVVLTGWAGQVSLGQMGFAGIGAAVGAVATRDWGLDLTVAIPLAGLVGAAAATVVGLPALRLRGLFLGVATLGFALATSSYFLNRQFFDWIPVGRIERPDLLGAIELDSEVRMYYFTLAVLVLSLLAVRGIRRSRTGRVLVALRENELAAQAFGVSATRAKLTAFALSGFLAASAGAVFVHHERSFSVNQYAVFESFSVFSMAVIGGLGSLAGAVAGAFYLRGTQWFIDDSRWQLLATSGGLLLVLMVVPGGLGAVAYRIRDQLLRWVADRRGIVVPSLVADVAVEEPDVLAAESADEPAMAGS